jgi:hypothetical protein
MVIGADGQKTEIDCETGVIHVVDGVTLMPEDEEFTADAGALSAAATPRLTGPTEESGRIDGES